MTFRLVVWGLDYYLFCMFGATIQITMHAGCEFACIGEQNALHLRQLATRLSTCIAICKIIYKLWPYGEWTEDCCTEFSNKFAPCVCIHACNIPSQQNCLSYKAIKTSDTVEYYPWVFPEVLCAHVYHSALLSMLLNYTWSHFENGCDLITHLRQAYQLFNHAFWSCVLIFLQTDNSMYAFYFSPA